MSSLPTIASPSTEAEPANLLRSRALTEVERTRRILEVMHAERFVDMAPPSVYATLLDLDEGTYMASVPTIYRILRSVDEVRERRRVAVHPPSMKPELLATAPNMVWPGPAWINKPEEVASINLIRTAWCLKGVDKFRDQTGFCSAESGMSARYCRLCKYLSKNFTLCLETVKRRRLAWARICSADLTQTESLVVLAFHTSRN